MRKFNFRSWASREARISPVPGQISFTKDIRLRNNGSKLMNVNGSVTPVDFRFAPASDEFFLLECVTLLMVDDGVTGASNFGTLAPLSNGLLLRGQTNGFVHDTTNMIDNADIFQCFFGATGVPGTGPNTAMFDTGDWLGGAYMFRNEYILDGSKGDFIEIIVRDDLSSIDTLQSSLRLKQLL